MKKNIYLSSMLVGCFMLLSSVTRAAAPVISTNPYNDTVCSGTVALFIVVASDTSSIPTPVTYQWQVSTNGGASWSIISTGGAYSGATTDSLSVTTSFSLNGYLYRCKATNTGGTSTSLAAVLSVDS